MKRGAGGGLFGGRGRAEWLVDLSLIERDRGWQLQQESRLRVPREVAIPFWLLPRLRARVVIARGQWWLGGSCWSILSLFVVVVVVDPYYLITIVLYTS